MSSKRGATKGMVCTMSVLRVMSSIRVDSLEVGVNCAALSSFASRETIGVIIVSECVGPAAESEAFVEVIVGRGCGSTVSRSEDNTDNRSTTEVADRSSEEPVCRDEVSITGCVGLMMFSK